MYCDECGRLLNRATGRCVCADGAPRPAEVVVEPVLVGAAAFAPIEPIAAPAVPPPPAEHWPPPQPHDRRTMHPVIPRVRTSTKVYDLHVFRDRLVLDKVPGTDPELLWSMLGFLALCGLLGAVIGNMFGRHLAKNATAKRVHDTAWLTAEELASRAGARQVADHEVAGLVARHHGAGGRLRLRLQSGETIKASWSKPHIKGIDIAHALAGFATGRIAVHPMSTARKIGRGAFLSLVALCVVLMTAGLGFALVSDGPPQASANPALDRACTTWGALAAKGQNTTFGEVQDTIRTVQPDLQAAALVDPAVQPAADAAVFLAEYINSPDPAIAGQMQSHAATIDRACGLQPPG